jgi:mRNA-degrading endonuclease RelE of RelBE toxin-antitoxin system
MANVFNGTAWIDCEVARQRRLAQRRTARRRTEGPVPISLTSPAPRDTASPAVFQIIFNEISAAEISGLDTMSQLELLNQFKVRQQDLDDLNDGDGHFGTMERHGKKLYRYRSKDYRIYFEVKDDNVIVHRVLNRNTFQDFLFRSKLPLNEDEALGESKHFWSLIEEGEKARKVQK